ncbi:amylo-alpha-1,6-glucosidase [Micromonospora sp. LZ34]
MAAVRRPTPADPMPDAVPEDQIPCLLMRRLSPELGPNPIAVLDGPSFMYSDAAGDVPKDSIGGLVHHDTRFLNRWELTLNGAKLRVLSSSTVDYYSAAFSLTNPELPGLAANAVCVRRQRFVGNGLHERIQLECWAQDSASVHLRLAVGTDFADILEIKETIRDRSPQITRSHAPDGSRLDFSYRNASFEARTEVRVDPPASRVEGDDLVWDIQLEPRQAWWCDLAVPLRYGETEMVPTRRDFGEVSGAPREDPGSRWAAHKPVLRADADLLCEVYHQSAMDLLSMRIEKRIGDRTIILISAGLPWFLTLFGRDTLITAYQTVSLGPHLAHGVLLELAQHQGREFDDFSDQEPGKILHEYRSGELANLRLRPYAPYYGTADATQLWLILLSEYWRWTLDDDFVRGLRDNVYAALKWIDEYGDLDHDGYIEYATRTPHGLGNQCWRDSWDGIQFADGSIPVLPIATCEIQGYTYDAKLRLAELADGPLGDPELGKRLRADADELRERFNRDFWIDERGGYYAIGLDGDKRKIDSMTSNMGHLLWSGIVPQERAEVVARQLMSEHMFSGWGVRTTSTLDRGYNPIGYHMGTVWPHDNALIAHGLAKYGFRDEANRIIMAMLDAARFSNNRLPEAFSGYDRSAGRTPVLYPTACNPQAWASAAPMLFVRTLLGYDVRGDRIILDPHIPEQLGRIMLSGARAFGRRWDLEAIGTNSHVRLSSTAPMP